MRTHAQANKAAQKIAGECGRAVLVKGGHGPGKLWRDCLAIPDAGTAWFEGPRIVTRNTHGTGCVLSAAIAAWLGRRADLASAVRLAQSFLQRALLRGRGLEWGPGKGPALLRDPLGGRFIAQPAPAPDPVAAGPEIGHPLLGRWAPSRTGCSIPIPRSAGRRCGT